jgi:hypothetical protein
LAPGVVIPPTSMLCHQNGTASMRRWIFLRRVRPPSMGAGQATGPA